MSNSPDGARPSLVNDQIVDAVAQTRRDTTGSSGAQSMAFIDTVSAETMGMGMHNAVAAQRQMQILTAAAVATTCAKLLSIAPGKPKDPTPNLVPPVINNPFPPSVSPSSRPNLREIIALSEKSAAPTPSAETGGPHA